MIPQDRIERLYGIIRQARATGNAEVLAKATSLLGEVLRCNAAEAGVSPDAADPMTRARARESGGRAAEGLRKLRKGRDQCSATRRDGEPCQAPAIAEGLVCRRHGGGSPQARIAAEHRQYQMAAYAATREFEEARGTPREFDALCAALAAGRELDAYEVKLRLLAELRAELKRKRATAGTMRTPEDPWMAQSPAPAAATAPQSRTAPEPATWPPC